MTLKVNALQNKVKERRGRVAKILEEHHITSEMLSDMIIQYMKDQQHGNSRMIYSISNAASPANVGKTSSPDVLIPAGVVSNIVTEKNLIDSETAEAQRITLIVRNLRDTLPAVDEKTGALVERSVVHTLSDEEIEYLGL